MIHRSISVTSSGLASTSGPTQSAANPSTVSHHGRRTVMVQRYLPEIVDGDKRVLLVGGQVMEYCPARIPKAGETRGNLAAGGTGVAQELSARDREIAEALGPVLFKRGLMLVGIDVIGDYLTEINVTSPTGAQQLKRFGGPDVANVLWNRVEAIRGVI